MKGTRTSSSCCWSTAPIQILPQDGAPDGLALYEACCRNRLEIAELLLKHGANPNAGVDSSECCLTIGAIYHGEQAKPLQELLRRHGAFTPPYKMDVEQLKQAIRDGHEVVRHEEFLGNVMAQADAELLDLYLDSDPTVVERMQLGGSVVYPRSAALVRKLLERGLDPNRPDWSGKTMLHACAANGDRDVAAGPAGCGSRHQCPGTGVPGNAAGCRRLFLFSGTRPAGGVRARTWLSFSWNVARPRTFPTMSRGRHRWPGHASGAWSKSSSSSNSRRPQCGRLRQMKPVPPYSALTSRQKIIELVRWTCVLPAAKLGDLVGYGFGGALGLFAQSLGIVNPPSDDSSSNRMQRYLIWLIPVGLTVVIAAAKTAPRWRLATAVAIAVSWVLWTDRIHGFEGPTVIGTAVSACCGIAVILYWEVLRQRVFVASASISRGHASSRSSPFSSHRTPPNRPQQRLEEMENRRCVG